MASVLPSHYFSCIQFSVPSRIECRQVTPCCASSASGPKAGQSQNFFQTQDVEFYFCPKGRDWQPLEAPIAPKMPVLKLSRPLACKPPAAIVSESARVACASCAKPQLTGLRHRRSRGVVSGGYPRVDDEASTECREHAGKIGNTFYDRRPSMAEPHDRKPILTIEQQIEHLKQKA